jgi:hypothetical protein
VADTRPETSEPVSIPEPALSAVRIELPLLADVAAVVVTTSSPLWDNGIRGAR